MRFATANTPWTGADVLAALADQALRRCHRLLDLDPHLIQTRPAVVLAGLLRDLDVDADHPGLIDQESTHEPLPELPEHDCDHGWVNITTASGHDAVTRCIGGVRCAQLHAYDAAQDDLHPGYDDDEPAF